MFLFDTELFEFKTGRCILLVDPKGSVDSFARLVRVEKEYLEFCEIQNGH